MIVVYHTTANEILGNAVFEGVQHPYTRNLIRFDGKVRKKENLDEKSEQGPPKSESIL